MTDGLALLEQAKQHLIASEPELSMRKMHEFERALLDGAIRKDSIDACSQALLAIRGLSEAAREGLLSAQRQLAEIAALSRNLDTYDRQGRRIGSQVTQGREQRF